MNTGFEDPSWMAIDVANFLRERFGKRCDSQES